MTRDETLDRAFMTTYTRNSGSGWDGTYLPNSGAIGTTDFYVTQRADGSELRSRGSLHLDPDLLVDGKWPAAPGTWDPHAPDVAWLDRFAGRPKRISKASGEARFGYVRSIAGDLSLTTSEWRTSAGAGGGDAGPGDPAPGGTRALVAIPRVRGMSRADAKAALLAAGLRASDTYRKGASSSRAQGTGARHLPRVPARRRHAAEGAAGHDGGDQLSSGPADPTPTPTPSSPGSPSPRSGTSPSSRRRPPSIGSGSRSRVPGSGSRHRSCAGAGWWARRRRTCATARPASSRREPPSSSGSRPDRDRPHTATPD